MHQYVWGSHCAWQATVAMAQALNIDRDNVILWDLSPWCAAASYEKCRLLEDSTQTLEQAQIHQDQVWIRQTDGSDRCPADRWVHGSVR